MYQVVNYVDYVDYVDYVNRVWNCIFSLFPFQKKFLVYSRYIHTLKIEKRINFMPLVEIDLLWPPLSTLNLSWTQDSRDYKIRLRWRANANPIVIWVQN